jgi:DNA polymerase-3 subunit epsilon
LKRLAEKLSVEGNEIPKTEGERDYRALLWRALEDGQIEEAESDALVEVATNWNIPLSRIKAIHFDYLSELAKAAWADNFLSDSERKEILNAAHLLGFGPLSEEELQNLVKTSENTLEEEQKTSSVSLLAGKSVCFTGECYCTIDGETITRNLAEMIAADKGLKVATSVTKKLDLLVVADPNTQSGKAKLARKYGIRIVSERFFWRTLEIAVD